MNKRRITLLTQAILDDDVGLVSDILQLTAFQRLCERASRLRKLQASEAFNSPLHIAAYANSIAVAEFLLSSGADPNAVNAVGETPLHFASRSGSWEVADLLVARGADIRAEAHNGDTPADLAKQHGNLNVVELLKLLEEKTAK
jgi:ankyrin repeat protein